MFSVRPTRLFEKEAKLLIKKYISLREELYELGKELSQNPSLGITIGRSCYKVRLGIKSKGRGKSGGARVITYLLNENKEVILLTIYDKQVKADLKPNELDEILKDLD